MVAIAQDTYLTPKIAFPDPVNIPGMAPTLKNAGWDIAKVIAPADLGVPAFDIGSKAFSTGDFQMASA